MTEDEFLRAVVDLAKFRGWRVAHFRPALTRKGWRTPVQGHNGFPDLVLARRGRVIFAELKSEVGRLTPDQRQWQVEMGTAIPVVVWRPSMLRQIAETLR